VRDILWHGKSWLPCSRARAAQPSGEVLQNKEHLGRVNYRFPLQTIHGFLYLNFSEMKHNEKAPETDVRERPASGMERNDRTHW
jgi:hypothetical protein